MLKELTSLQDSDETVWDTVDLSFSIRTRDDGAGQLVERAYEFNHAKEWNKWVFTSFEERRVDASSEVSSRNWQTTHSTSWDEPTEIPSNINVPHEVQQELEERLDVGKIVLQQP